MTLRRRPVLLFCFVSLTAVLGGMRTTAQSFGPRPNVALQPVPSLAVSPWPADVNKDGRVDLIAGHAVGFANGQSTGGELVLRLGNGDGTFGPEQTIATPTAAAPIGTADFNGDGHLDIVAIDITLYEFDTAERYVWIVPGNGDGTFDAAVTVDRHLTNWYHYQYVAWTFALAQDFDGDGRLDLAIGADPDALHFYPGNGDFTFDTRVTLTTGAWPRNGVASDLNGDGRLDVAVAARDGQKVDVFINRGGFTFGTSSILLDRSPTDVIAQDLNRDGKNDLIVTAGTESVDYIGAFFDGQVLVIAGNGDGTFQAPVSYETEDGPLKLVAGDFNRDGLTDIATGNYPFGVQEDCEPFSSSVSILPGNGTGALGGAASFQFHNHPNDIAFNKRLHSLSTAQLDGDSHADLIASGMMVLNRAAAANRPPVANAGPDKIQDQKFSSVVPEPQASDPDNDFLSYRWTDETGRLVEPCLVPLGLNTPGPGEYTFTLTVTDGRGGTASDSMIVRNTTTNNGPHVTVHSPTFNSPVPAYDPFTIRWSASDPDGSAIADVDISVDRNGQNNFVPITECTNLPGSVTQCVWNDPGPPSSDAALLFQVTDAQGDRTNTVVRFQIVAPRGGPLPSGWSNRDVGAVAAAGSAAFDNNTFIVRGSGADIWGTHDEFHWAYTPMTGDFAILGRVATVENVNPWTKAGLMIRESHGAGSRHASVFATPSTAKPVAFQRRATTNGPSVHTAGPSTVPPVWLMMRRTGDVIAAYYRTDPARDWIAIGTQTIAGLSPTVQVGMAVSSHVDGTIATATFDNVALATGTPFALQVLRPRAGERIQVNAPFTIRWLPNESAADIARFDVFFSQSADGPWSAIAECSNLGPERRSCVWHRPSPLGNGFVKVVARTRSGDQVQALSDMFQIVLDASGPGGLPPGWLCGDVGDVGAGGSCRYEVEDELSPDFVIEGSGADIWGTSDEFSFAGMPAYGDFSITARVLAVENVHDWTKAGIMIRNWDFEDPAFEEGGSAHASFFVTPTTTKGTAFQRRPVGQSTSVHTAGPVTTAPLWLKLVRTGNVIAAYYRKETTDRWTLVGTQSFTALPYQLAAMLVVSSHVDGTLATARFDNVVIEEVKPMQSIDIVLGASVAGSTRSAGPEIAIEGDGGDIWGTTDAFRFHYTRWNGNGQIIVRVLSLENTHAWAKAGVMFRETLLPDSKHVMAIVSPSRGIALQSRTATGGASTSTVPIPGTAPVWLSLRRFGDSFQAGWSEDGEFWHSLGQVTISMGADIYVGLPVTSHAVGVLSTALFDDLVIAAR